LIAAKERIERKRFKHWMLSHKQGIEVALKTFGLFRKNVGVCRLLKLVVKTG